MRYKLIDLNLGLVLIKNPAYAFTVLRIRIGLSKKPNLDLIFNTELRRTKYLF